jgi:hypothetical protein
MQIIWPEMADPRTPGGVGEAQGGPRAAVQPGRLSFDPSGLPFSERFGDLYSSRDGAFGQARHVFLGGN